VAFRTVVGPLPRNNEIDKICQVEPAFLSFFFSLSFAGSIPLDQQTRSSNRQIITDGSRLSTLLLFLVPLSVSFIPAIFIPRMTSLLSATANFINKNAILITAHLKIVSTRKKAERYSLFGVRINLVHASGVRFTSRVKYDDEREEYKREVQTALKLVNPLGCAKARMEKPPERSPFPCLSPLYYETHEIFRVSEAHFCI